MCVDAGGVYCGVSWCWVVNMREGGSTTSPTHPHPTALLPKAQQLHIPTCPGPDSPALTTTPSHNPAPPTPPPPNPTAPQNPDGLKTTQRRYQTRAPIGPQTQSTVFVHYVSRRNINLSIIRAKGFCSEEETEVLMTLLEKITESSAVSLTSYLSTLLELQQGD